MSRSRLLGILVSVALATTAVAASGPGIEPDHVWIMVSLNAPERAALERAGFQISKDVNHHEGTGTSSVTVEFENTYLELMWPDPKVPVTHGMERVAEKYHQRQLWRTSGWCPIGVGFRRTTPSNEALPIPVWTWTADWMPKGSVMEMLTPRDDTRSPALFVEPPLLSKPRRASGACRALPPSHRRPPDNCYPAHLAQNVPAHCGTGVPAEAARSQHPAG
jgi:hypothetical protein